MRLAALLAAALAAAQPSLAAAEEGLNGTQRDEVVQMIEAYLLNNPDVLARAIARLGEAGKGGGRLGNVAAIVGAATPEARAAFADRSRGLAVVVANPGGSRDLVVAFDYACPHCRTLEPRLSEAASRHPGVRVVLRETPILTPESELAAKVGAAVAGQGASTYARYHRALMRRKGPLHEQAILDAARSAGADLEAVARDAASPRVAAAIEENRALLRGLGVLATPMLAFGGEVRHGSLQPAELDALMSTNP